MSCSATIRTKWLAVGFCRIRRRVLAPDQCLRDQGSGFPHRRRQHAHNGDHGAPQPCHATAARARWMAREAALHALPKPQIRRFPSKTPSHGAIPPRAADEGKWDSQWLRCRVSPRVSRELSPGFGSATAPKIFGHLTRARSYIRICTGNSRMPRMKLEKRRLGGPITWMSRSRASISSQRIFNCRSASRSPTQRWMPAP